MPTPPGRLTRGEIINRALADLGNRNIVADARFQLNAILYDLHTQWEWPHLYTTANPTLNQATFALPADFLKAQDDGALSILTQDGIENFSEVRQVDPRTFNLMAVSRSAEGTPIIWTVDRNLDVGKLWPIPTNVALTAELRYKHLPADVDETDTATYDADIPIFPWHRHLIKEVFVWGLRYENDPRHDTESILLAQSLSAIRDTAQPLHSQKGVIPLDDGIFSTPFRDS